jgi:hypothetical protein
MAFTNYFQPKKEHERKYVLNSECDWVPRNKILVKIEEQKIAHAKYEKRYDAVAEYVWEASKASTHNTDPSVSAAGTTLKIELTHNCLDEDFKHPLLSYNFLKKLSEMCGSTDIHIKTEYDGRCCSSCGLDPTITISIIVRSFGVGD